MSHSFDDCFICQILVQLAKCLPGVPTASALGWSLPDVPNDNDYLHTAHLFDQQTEFPCV